MTSLHFSFEETAAAALDGWERRTQETYITPATKEEVDGLLGEAAEIMPAPRPNLVVSRVPGQGTADKACADFVEQTERVVPDFQIVRAQHDFVFNDNTRGTSIVIEFRASDSVRLVQQHVFRSDQGISTQLVATMAKGQEAACQEPFEKIMRGFRPLSA